MVAISKRFIEHLPKASATDCIRFVTAIEALGVTTEFMYWKVTCHFLGVGGDTPAMCAELLQLLLRRRLTDRVLMLALVRRCLPEDGRGVTAVGVVVAMKAMVLYKVGFGLSLWGSQGCSWLEWLEGCQGVALLAPLEHVPRAQQCWLGCVRVQ